MGPGRSAGPVYVWQRGARTRSEPGSADPLLSISGKRVRVEERARCLLRVAAGLPLAAAWHTAAAAVCLMHTAAAASPPLAVAYCHLPLQLAAAACRCCLLLKSLGNRDRGWPLRLWHSRPNPLLVTHTIIVGGSEPSTLCTAANLSLRKQNIILHPTQHTPPNILDCPTACPSSLSLLTSHAHYITHSVSIICDACVCLYHLR